MPGANGTGAIAIGTELRPDGLALCIDNNRTYIGPCLTTLAIGPQDASPLNQARRPRLSGGRVRDGTGLRAVQPCHRSSSLGAHRPSASLLRKLSISRHI